MRRLLIKRSSWWDQPGCSCCEGDEMPYYEVYLEGQRVDMWAPLDREQALEAFLETLGYEVEYEDEED